jgi:hypothetical protein
MSFSLPTELLAPAGALPFASQQLSNLLSSTYGTRLEAARQGASGLLAWDRVEVAVRGGVVRDRFAL